MNRGLGGARTRLHDNNSQNNIYMNQVHYLTLYMAHISPKQNMFSQKNNSERNKLDIINNLETT